MGKSFKGAAAAARPVYNQIIGSTQQEHNTQDVQTVQSAYNTHEASDTPETQSAPVEHDVQEVLGTQGRKGAKLPRINMAFSPANLEYLRIMAGLNGQSITRYVNAMIERERRENTVFEDAKKLINKQK